MNKYKRFLIYFSFSHQKKKSFVCLYYVWFYFFLIFIL